MKRCGFRRANSGIHDINKVWTIFLEREHGVLRKYRKPLEINGLLYFLLFFSIDEGETAIYSDRDASRGELMHDSRLQPKTRVLMMPRDTNPAGTIFGGVILSYIDIDDKLQPLPFVTDTKDGHE